MANYIEQAKNIILGCVRHPSCGDMKVTIHYDTPLNCHVYLGLDPANKIYGLNIVYIDNNLKISFYNWYHMEIVKKHVPDYETRPLGSATINLNTNNLNEIIKEEVLFLLFNHLTSDINGEEDESSDIFIEYTSLVNDSIKFRKIEDLVKNAKKKLPGILINDDIVEQIKSLISHILKK